MFRPHLFRDYFNYILCCFERYTSAKYSDNNIMIMHDVICIFEAIEKKLKITLLIYLFTLLYLLEVITLL